MEDDDDLPPAPLFDLDNLDPRAMRWQNEHLRLLAEIKQLQREIADLKLECAKLRVRIDGLLKG